MFFGGHVKLSRWRVLSAAWAASCCASGACAALLCAVLWARFARAPLLLTATPLSTPAASNGSVPMVALCPSPYRAAQSLAENLSMDLKEMEWLPILFSEILRGKPAADSDRLLLDNLLRARNLTLSRALVDLSPCKELLKKCQWQSAVVPCRKLFRKELTRWGACCVTTPKRLSEFKSLSDQLLTTQRLDMNMDCFVTRNYDFYCAEFFVKYPDEDWLGPWYLMSGYSYTSQLVFTHIHDTDINKLVNGKCVSDPLYSQSRCMIICKETECGCSHPLRLREDYEINLPPPCSVSRMKCLGNFIRESKSCNCLPACQRTTGYMSTEAIEIIENVYSYNPIYENINSNSSIVLKLGIQMRGSKSFDLIPTVTWLTLLSSMGGVFNMFLGIGLFSLLECIFLLLKCFFISV